MFYYHLLTLLLWPVFFLYTLRITFRDKSFRYFLQRLGFGYPQQTQQTLWIHCASVGEVNTYLPLHLKLLETFPHRQFVITSNTTTGASTVQRHNPQRTTHCYLPIESRFAIKRFLAACKPQQCLIMETEIWPLLYQYCQQQHSPLSIINARLSHRTLHANRWIKSVYKHSLARVDKILCKSAEELENFRTLGASEQQLVIAGNLKFAMTDSNSQINPVDLQQRHYCVAASTHNDEEKQLAECWVRLKTDRLLVIAPRHPNRSAQIQTQLNVMGVKYAVRSKQQVVDKDTVIYLADTLGELTQFMQGADFIFIGGSLVKHGGQNILEPARLGKATICGPHMFNFKDELALLLQHQACIQINNTDELAKTFQKLLDNPQVAVSLGENATRALAQQNRILDEYLRILFKK